MNNINEITCHNPFICNCFKEYWLFLQYFIELSNDKLINTFWHYFNKSIKLIEENLMVISKLLFLKLS